MGAALALRHTSGIFFAWGCTTGGLLSAWPAIQICRRLHSTVTQSMRLYLRRPPARHRAPSGMRVTAAEPSLAMSPD